jgi:ferredoxin
MIACEGHGLCAEAFPEMISRDPWGYPVPAPGAVPRELMRHAEHAVAVCPVLALRIVKEEPAAEARGPASPAPGPRDGSRRPRTVR